VDWNAYCMVIYGLMHYKLIYYALTKGFIIFLRLSVITLLHCSHPHLKIQIVSVMNMIWWILSYSLWSFLSIMFKFYFSLFSFCENSQKNVWFIENYETVSRNPSQLANVNRLVSLVTRSVKCMKMYMKFEEWLASCSLKWFFICIETTIIIAPCHHSNLVFKPNM